MDDGAVVSAYLDEIEALDHDLAAAGSQVADIRAELTSAVSAVRKATEWLNGSDDVAARMAGATPYQEMLGTLAGGYYLARQAVAAIEAGTDDPWFEAKVATARFYAVNLLPRVHGLVDASMSGAELLFAVGDELIGA